MCIGPVELEINIADLLIKAVSSSRLNLPARFFTLVDDFIFSQSSISFLLPVKMI